MSKPKAVGIDLGTTFSVVAWVNDQGRTEVIRNPEGEILTPSIVLFEDAEVVVGKTARGALAVHPDRVAEFVKRDMGAPVYTRPIRGEYLPPEVIQACVLRKLKASIVRSLGSDVRTVITVPAYFDEPRRKATADAGEMAGLSVLDIVNEPTAAALAFGESLGYLSPSAETTEEMTIFVYDLGGGTFDATLLKLSPGEVRAIATDGDVQLGGHDWDLRLLHHVAGEFKGRHGTDPREDLGAFNRLYAAVLDAKHTLTARSRATVRVEFAGYTDDIPVTRELFEELTIDLLERTSYTTRQLLATAGLEWSDVSRVLLVGGATRMPMVQRMLTEMTGILPDHTVNPDEAVARGAALYAHHLLSKQGQAGGGPQFEVVNVNAHSLGVEGIDPATFRKTNVVLIRRNTPLPAKVTEKFITKTESQRSIALKVLEGESTIPSECTAIGRTSIRDLPAGLPKGWPIEVTFEYATNGRLSVHATVPGTHREVSLQLERASGMSAEGISQWRGAMESPAGFDAFQEMLQDILAPDGDATPPSGLAHPASMDQLSPGQPSAKQPEGRWSPPMPGLHSPTVELPTGAYEAPQDFSTQSPVELTQEFSTQPASELTQDFSTHPSPAWNQEMPTPPEGNQPTQYWEQPQPAQYRSAPAPPLTPTPPLPQPIPVASNPPYYPQPTPTQQPTAPGRYGQGPAAPRSPAYPPHPGSGPYAQPPGYQPSPTYPQPPGYPSYATGPQGPSRTPSGTEAPQPQYVGFSKLRVPMWVVNVIGYILSALVGISVGWLLIQWLLPNSPMF